MKIDLKKVEAVFVHQDLPAKKQIGRFSFISPRPVIWRKPPRNVSYKRTFGTPDQGQMLEVWGDSCQADVNPKVSVMERSPSQPAEISNKKDIAG